MNRKLKCKLRALKFSTWVLTGAAQLVYSFHKRFPDIQTIYNVRYAQSKNKYHTMNVYYHRKKAPWISRISLKEQKACVRDLKAGNCVLSKKENTQKQRALPMIVYFHGGGWACYDKNLYDSLCGRLCQMGFVVFNANYTLTPKAQVEEMLADVEMAIEKARCLAPMWNADPNRVVLMGDSAGAHLASLVAGRALYDGQKSTLKRSIKALGLFYGVYDLHTVKYSNFPNLEVYLEALLPSSTPNYHEKLEEYSPITYISAQYPPTFIASGEIDKLHETQSKVFAEELQGKGAIVETKFFPLKELRAVHAYMTFDGLGTNEETIEALAKFFEKLGLINKKGKA